MPKAAPNSHIIISEDGKTWSFDRQDSEHEFYTIAGVENAIGRVREQLEALKNLSVSDQRIKNLEKEIEQLEVQRQLAIEGGV